MRWVGQTPVPADVALARSSDYRVGRDRAYANGSYGVAGGLVVATLLLSIGGFAAKQPLKRRFALAGALAAPVAGMFLSRWLNDRVPKLTGGQYA